MKATGVTALTAGAAVIALLIGIGIGRAGKSDLAERANRQDELSAAVAAMSDRMGAMEGRFDELSQRIGTVGEDVAGQSQRFGELSDRIGEMGTRMSDTVSGMASDISGTLSSQFEGLGARLATLGRPSETGMGAPAPGERVGPGETLMLGDGAARIFLSSVSPETRTARVAIDGTSLQTLALGTPVEAGGCSITLTGIAAPAATIDAVCGGKGSSGGAAAAGLGGGTEISIAQAASLADGAVRIYLSRVDTDTGSAMVAINGTTLSELTMGAPLEAGDCTVSLTGFTDRAVSVEASC